MSDELPTAARVSDPGIRALYRLENRWQAWLDVEVALAQCAGRARHHPERGRRGDRRRGAARPARPQAHRRGFRPHRPHDRAARLGIVARRRRAAWRLGALGRDDAEHHADRRPAGAAPGAPRLPAPDRRRAGRRRRSRRARRRHADRRPHARPARGAGDLRLQARGVDRRADPPCRAAATGGAAHLCRDARRRAPAPSPRSASTGRRCRPASPAISACSR